jgi:small subunit ribosomal protein S13
MLYVRIPGINSDKDKQYTHMRLLGITIPDNKRLEIGLTALYGVGRPRAHKILFQAGVTIGKKPPELSAQEENDIRRAVEQFSLEGDLRRDVATNVKRLKDIKSYRGVRHLRHLPLRGQRTRTNSRTVRGNVRKTMGSGKKKVEKK